MISNTSPAFFVLHTSTRWPSVSVTSQPATIRLGIVHDIVWVSLDWAGDFSLRFNFSWN